MIFETAGDDHDVSFFTPAQNPYGMTFVEWTIRWWEWALSVPIAFNPVLDQTGQNATRNQVGPVWFLTGTIGDVEDPLPETASFQATRQFFFR